MLDLAAHPGVPSSSAYSYRDESYLFLQPLYDFRARRRRLSLFAISSVSAFLEAVVFRAFFPAHEHATRYLCILYSDRRGVHMRIDTTTAVSVW